MEGRVYICGWEQNADGWRLWVKARPKVSAVGRTYEEATEALRDAVCLAYGDGEAVLDYIPELPLTELERKCCRPHLIVVSGADVFESSEPRFPSYATWEEMEVAVERYANPHFQDGLCRFCKAPRGPRTDHPIELTAVTPGADGGAVMLGQHIRYLFSEQFVALLSREERDRLTLLPTVNKYPIRKRFLEVAGPPEVSFVGCTSFTAYGTHCLHCGSRRFGYTVPGAGITQFIAAEDLPGPLPSCFVVGGDSNAMLCMTAERWGTIHGAKGARNVLAAPLGVVSGREVARTPELPLRNE